MVAVLPHERAFAQAHALAACFARAHAFVAYFALEFALLAFPFLVSLSRLARIAGFLVLRLSQRGWKCHPTTVWALLVSAWKSFAVVAMRVVASGGAVTGERKWMEMVLERGKEKKK